MAAWLRLDGLEAHAHPARLHEQHGPVESVHSAHMASWQLLGWAAGGTGHPFALLRPRPQRLGLVRVMQHLLRPFPLGHGCRRDREQLSTEQQSVFSTRASQRRRQRMGRSIFVIEIKKRRK